MKVLCQPVEATPRDWQEVDSAAWRSLPQQEMNQVNILGNIFTGWDHYAVEDVPNGRCRFIGWNDDPGDWPAGQRHALVHTFNPIAPDPAVGGALNAVQTRVIYAEPEAMARLLTTAPTDSFRPWEEFVPPDPALTRHGIWLGDAMFLVYRQTTRRVGWRDAPWTGHLAAEELDEKGRLLSQRDRGRWLKAAGTITYICRDTDRAVGYAAGVHEDALELTTGTAATETREVPLSTGDPGEIVWLFTTDMNQPNSADWPSGVYRIQYDVTVLDSGVKINNTAFARIIADGTTDLENTLIANDVTVTGLTIVSTPTFDFDPGSAGDRYSVGVLCNNSNTKGSNQTITLELNTSDSFADGPWVAAEAAANPVFEFRVPSFA